MYLLHMWTVLNYNVCLNNKHENKQKTVFLISHKYKIVSETCVLDKDCSL